MVERSRVTFPIIGDDEALQKDTRVILTNRQILTRNPSLQDENSLGETSKNETKKTDVNKPYRPKVSYSSQHRPLNGIHSGVSSFDKMPKKTSVDESKERAKRAAATLPERPKGYVHPLARDKEDLSVRRSNSAILNKRPVNDNPIQDMKRRGMNLSDAINQSEKQKDYNHVANAPKASSYFENKRKSIFDRGVV
ncbi:hypothetical protein ACFO26_02740 [Lactococcus nasutitermitis]|uniref:Uncharacterized protein n=1 Tax=Lactococcus nasutitermitis TaxID=1652957 RepID=A0ABV9JAQ9_9LACT|nr:hypothetical protein [Lactococcus nasutitermitis]